VVCFHCGVYFAIQKRDFVFGHAGGRDGAEPAAGFVARYGFRQRGEIRVVGRAGFARDTEYSQTPRHRMRLHGDEGAHHRVDAPADEIGDDQADGFFSEFKPIRRSIMSQVSPAAPGMMTRMLRAGYCCAQALMGNKILNKNKHLRNILASITNPSERFYRAAITAA
jgi:hypothetical protein